MNIFAPFWLDMIGLAVAMAFLDLAIIGKTYSHGKGGRTLLASVKSPNVRVMFFFIAMFFFGWVLKDFIHKVRP